MRSNASRKPFQIRLPPLAFPLFPASLGLITFIISHYFCAMSLLQTVASAPYFTKRVANSTSEPRENFTREGEEETYKLKSISFEFEALAWLK